MEDVFFFFSYVFFLLLVSILYLESSKFSRIQPWAGCHARFHPLLIVLLKSMETYIKMFKINHSHFIKEKTEVSRC